MKGIKRSMGKFIEAVQFLTIFRFRKPDGREPGKIRTHVPPAGLSDEVCKFGLFPEAVERGRL